MENKTIAKYLRIFALAFIFIVFGLWEIFNPQYWAGFVPQFAASIFNALILVRIHGVVLSLTALWLVSGKKRKYAAILSSLIMLEIVISLLVSTGFSDLLVRDIVILILAISLIFEN